MLTTIFLDLDDTLLDFKKSERVALSSALQTFGLTPTDEILTRYHVINQIQWELLERGQITREQVLHRRFSLLFEEYGLSINVDEMKATYEHILGNGHYFIDGAPELLEHLSSRYSVYLVTNGTAHIQRRRLESANITRFFNDIFISQEIGYNKPDSRYFEHCFNSIPNFQKEKAVIIGDSLSSDIYGGNLVSVRTCWFNPTHKQNTSLAVPDFEIAALRDLPDLLQTL